MGSGSTILLMYAACCGSILVVGGIAAGLYLWGRRVERRRSKQRPADE